MRGAILGRLWRKWDCGTTFAYIQVMTPKKPEGPEKNDPATVADNAPVDHDSHGNTIKRVPGPGPNDEGQGAAGNDAVDRLKKG